MTSQDVTPARLDLQVAFKVTEINRRRWRFFKQSTVKSDVSVKISSRTFIVTNIWGEVNMKTDEKF